MVEVKLRRRDGTGLKIEIGPRIPTVKDNSKKTKQNEKKQAPTPMPKIKPNWDAVWLTGKKRKLLR